jgi:hypothetical protein
MAVTLDQFMAAIRQQESGGNYKVVNSIGALGAYQIMTANLPSWSKKALGHSISVSEFLSHPDEQDEIARKIMAPNFAKYGPAGTAAIWYSGQPDATKTYGNPPVYKYVASVLALIGKSGSVTGGKGGSTTTQTDDVSGSTVKAAGLQQAGYDAVVDLTPYGIPLNPFKLPGWMGGELSQGLGDSASGALGAAGGAMWDALGPIVLAALGVATGAALVVIGMYVTAKPAVDEKKQEALQLASAMPLPV